MNARVTQIPLAGDPERILLIKPSSLGDVVHTLPILVALRRRFPRSRITWLVAPYCAGLVQGLPQVDDVMLFDRRRFGGAWRSASILRALFAFKRELRKREFDLVIDLQGLLRSAYLGWRTGAKARVGFAKAREGAPLFYTYRVGVGDPEQHAIDRYLKVAAALGCDVSSIEFPFPVKDADRAHVGELLETDAPVAVLLPGTNWLTKRWPAERFEALVRPLKDRLGLESVIAGGPDAVELSSRIPGARSLAGRTNLPQLVALLERASLVIANDSGPMHIAAALNRPLVTLFGPTNPIRTGPYQREDSVLRLDLPCSPCYSRRCSHQSCLQLLEIEPVLRLAEQQLHQRGGMAPNPPLVAGAGSVATL